MVMAAVAMVEENNSFGTELGQSDVCWAVKDHHSRPQGKKDMVDGCGGWCYWWKYFAKVFCSLGYLAVYERELQLPQPEMTSFV